MLDEKFNQWARNYHRMDPTDPPITWEHEEQTYTATFRRHPAIADTDIEQVIVEVSTIDKGKRLSTEMRIKRLAFSHYAQFINRWDPDIQINKDEIDGRLHPGADLVERQFRLTHGASNPKFGSRLRRKAYDPVSADAAGTGIGTQRAIESDRNVADAVPRGQRLRVGVG